MWGYLLKAKPVHFPKHIKKSYANGLRQHSCGCIVILICIHCGSSWQGLCLPSALICGAHLGLTFTHSQQSDMLRGVLLTPGQTSGSNTVWLSTTRQKRPVSCVHWWCRHLTTDTNGTVALMAAFPIILRQMENSQKAYSRVGWFKCDVTVTWPECTEQ